MHYTLRELWRAITLASLKIRTSCLEFGPNQGPSSTSCALFTFDTDEVWFYRTAGQQLTASGCKLAFAPKPQCTAQLIVNMAEDVNRVCKTMVCTVVSVIADDVDTEELAVGTVVSDLINSPLLELLEYDEPVRTRTTIESFLSVTVPSYSWLEFKEHFRISRSCFEVNKDTYKCLTNFLHL